MGVQNINLQDYRTPGAKVFTGRDRGASVRENSKINAIIRDSSIDKVVIAIPEDIRSINPSFLEEFLVNVVTALGAEKFKAKVNFDNPGRYKIEDDLNEAIERILREENALA